VVVLSRYDRAEARISSVERANDRVLTVAGLTPFCP
jgi:hypothetical protein